MSLSWENTGRRDLRGRYDRLKVGSEFAGDTQPFCPTIWSRTHMLRCPTDRDLVRQRDGVRRVGERRQVGQPGTFAFQFVTKRTTQTQVVLDMRAQHARHDTPAVAGHAIAN